VDIALEEAKKQGIEGKKVTLIEKKIGWCVGHVECGFQPVCLLNQDDGNAIVEKLFSADGVILASPVYMKEALEVQRGVRDEQRTGGT